MRRRLKGVPGLYVVSVLLVLATLGLVGFVVVQLSNSLDVLRAQYVSLHTEYEGLYDEAVDEGVTPSAPAPEDVPDAEPQAPQIVLGAPGPEGERGPAGVRGPQGRTGPPGEIGPPGPVGKPGKDGADGSNGADGFDGAPGRGIQSMQCATGGWVVKYTDLSSEPDPGLCRGPQGEQGEQGPQGEPGADSTVPGPQGIRGPQGTARPGTYTCPDGETVVGFTVADDGDVTLSCEAFAAPPIIDPSPLE